MIKAICIGGPCDGQLIKVDKLRARILMNSPHEFKFMLEHQNDSNLLNEPISLYEYNLTSIQFPDITTKLEFYVFRRKV